MTTSQPGIGQLVSKVHTNIDNINEVVQSLSDIIHSQELERLAIERESAIHSLREKRVDALKQILTLRAQEKEEIDNKRRQERELIEKQRLTEWHEILAKRKKEDEIWQQEIEAQDKGIENLRNAEDEEREKEREEEERVLFEKCEGEIERLQTEIQSRATERKLTLQKLDEERKIINAQVEAALSAQSLLPEMIFQNHRPKKMPKHESCLAGQYNKNSSVMTPKNSPMDAYPETSDTILEAKEEKNMSYINYLEHSTNSPNSNNQQNLWQKAIDTKGQDGGENWHQPSHNNHHEHKELRLVTILQKEMNGSLWRRPFPSVQNYSSQGATVNSRDTHLQSTHSRRLFDSKVENSKLVAEGSIQKIIKLASDKSKLCDHALMSPVNSTEIKTEKIISESESIDMSCSNTLKSQRDEFITSEKVADISIPRIRERTQDNPLRKDSSNQSCQTPAVLLASQESNPFTNAWDSLEDSKNGPEDYCRNDFDCPEFVDTNFKISANIKPQVDQNVSSSETSSQEPARLENVAIEIQDHEYIRPLKGLERKNTLDNKKSLEEAGIHLDHPKRLVDKPISGVKFTVSEKSSETLESCTGSPGLTRKQPIEPICSNQKQNQSKESYECGESSDTALVLISSSSDFDETQNLSKDVLDLKSQVDSTLPHKNHISLANYSRMTGPAAQNTNPIGHDLSTRGVSVLEQESQSEFKDKNVEIEFKIPVESPPNIKSSEKVVNLSLREEKSDTALSNLSNDLFASVEGTQILQSDSILNLGTATGLRYHYEVLDRANLDLSARRETTTKFQSHPELLFEPSPEPSSLETSNSDNDSNYNENLTPTNDPEKTCFYNEILGEQSLTTNYLIKSIPNHSFDSNESQAVSVTKCEDYYSKTEKYIEKLVPVSIIPDSEAYPLRSGLMEQELSKTACTAISSPVNQLDQMSKNNSSENLLLVASSSNQTPDGIKIKNFMCQEINQLTLDSSISDTKSPAIKYTNSMRNPEKFDFAKLNSPNLLHINPDMKIKANSRPLIGNLPYKDNIDHLHSCKIDLENEESKHDFILVNSRIKRSISRDLAAIYGKQLVNNCSLSNPQPSSALGIEAFAANNLDLNTSLISNTSENIFIEDLCMANNKISRDHLKKETFQEKDNLDTCLGMKDQELVTLSLINNDKVNEVIAYMPVAYHDVQIGFGSLESKSDENKVFGIESDDIEKENEAYSALITSSKYQPPAQKLILNYDDNNFMKSYELDFRLNDISSKFPEQSDNTPYFSVMNIDSKEICRFIAPQCQDLTNTFMKKDSSSTIYQSFHPGSSLLVKMQGITSENLSPLSLSCPINIIRYNELYSFNISMIDAENFSNHDSEGTKISEAYFNQNSSCFGTSPQFSKGNLVEATKLIRSQIKVEEDKIRHSNPQFEADLKILANVGQSLAKGFSFGNLNSSKEISEIHDYKENHGSPYTDFCQNLRGQLDCESDLAFHQTEIQWLISLKRASTVNYDMQLPSEGSQNRLRNNTDENFFRASDMYNETEELGLSTAPKLLAPYESSENSEYSDYSDDTSPTMSVSEATSSLLHEESPNESIHSSTNPKHLSHTVDEEVHQLNTSAIRNEASFGSFDSFSYSSRINSQDDSFNMLHHKDYDFWRESSFWNSPETSPFTHEKKANIPLPVSDIESSQDMTAMTLNFEKARARFEYHQNQSQNRNNMRNKSSVRPLSGLLNSRRVFSKPNRRLNFSKNNRRLNLPQLNSSITCIIEDEDADEDSSASLESYSSKEISSKPSISSTSSQLPIHNDSRQFHRKEQSRISFFEGLQRGTVISPTQNPASPIRIS